MSKIRLNFHEKCEAAINKQINFELYASYVYLSVGYYCQRENVALHGLSKWALKSSDEEKEHAHLLMRYQVQRGGRVVLQEIQKPEKDEWGTCAEILESVLALENNNHKALLDLHTIASKHNDAHLTNFLEGEMLEEQVRSVKDVSDMCTRIKRAGPGLGEHLFDKELID